MTKPRSILWLSIVSAAAVLAAGAIVGGVSSRRPNVTDALPPLPDLQGSPADLGDRMRAARAKALSSATRAAGVEEFGALCHANGFLGEADRCWDLLRTLQPGEGRWTYRKADVRRLRGDDAGMAALLRETVQLAPKYAPAWLRLADWEFKQGALDNAVRGYRRRLDFLADDPYARLGLARVALQRDDRGTARSTLEKLVRDAPDFSSAHNLYAEVLEADGEVERAKHERLRGTEAGRFREADDPWLDDLIDACYDYDQLCFRGTKEVLVNRRERAQALFQRAIAINPRRATAYDLLGSLHAEANDLDAAREMFERALALATDTPAPVKTYVSLSRMYRLAQQPAAAIRLLRQATERLGPRPELDEALGVAFSQAGENADAIAALQRAVAVNPTNATWQYELAIELLNAGQRDSGVAALHKSLAAEPTFPAALGLLAQLEIESDHWQAAVAYLAPLYDANPDAPGAREKMTDCYLRAGDEARTAGDLASAERFYRAGLAIDANHAALQSRLANVLRTLAD